MEMELEHRLAPLLFVLAGTANVLLTKSVDISLSECKDGKFRHFQHPIVQTLLMFQGEFLCYTIYKLVYWFLQHRQDGSESENVITRGGREFSIFSFVLPAFLDAIASILLFTGLYLTYASSFQMIRGVAIIFIGIFSSVYLNQTLISRHWFAMLTICGGVVALISSDVQRTLYDRGSLTHADSNAVLTGDILIICGQIFHAAQIVYAEKHLKYSDIPVMQATGLQGAFGLCITLLLALAFNFIPTGLPLMDNSRIVFDDLADVYTQLMSNPWILIALGAFVISSAVYNYAALTIVKFSSGANCILAEGLRALLVWVFALLFMWEDLNMTTLFCFIILHAGALAYRNAIFLEWYRSLLSRLMRRRYADLTVDGEGGEVAASEPTSRPADLI